MSDSHTPDALPNSPIPPDDLRRDMVLAQADDPNLAHIGLVGDTYTVLLAGRDTADRYTLIDMHVPPGGGPPPHRHDFEEMFTILEGELEITFRGTTSVAHAGDTVNVPANAPHRFHNTSEQAARLLCMCTPAGQEDFFLEVGQPVAGRTTAPPKLSEADMEAQGAAAKALAPRYRTELL